MLRLGADSDQFAAAIYWTWANLASSSSTDFPVSKTEDRRLLANTSRDTSMNIWFVASKRRMQAGYTDKGKHIKPLRQQRTQFPGVNIGRLGNFTSMSSL